MEDEITTKIVIAVPIPNFIYQAFQVQDLAVIQDGYHSRYNQTKIKIDLLSLHAEALKEIRKLKEVYCAKKENGLIKDIPTKVDNDLFFSPMLGFNVTYTYGNSKPTLAKDLFNNVTNNTGCSDWNDYLWAGYNDYLMLVEIPNTRCMVIDERGVLIQLPTLDTEIYEGEIVIPFIFPKEIIKFYKKVENNEISDGERAWVDTKQPEKILWGSGHGSIIPKCREKILKDLAEVVPTLTSEFC